MICKFEHAFDSERCLQYVNNESAVMHCHHYSAIFTKLALATPALNGAGNLFDAMEETAYLTLRRYFTVEEVTATAERRQIAEEYFQLAGLGLVALDLSVAGGHASMRHSHVDEGWIKKWGQHPRPVNLIGQGYLAGAAAALFDQVIGSYAVKETQSLVMGAPRSEFRITRR